ncbi:MAG: hypothetical protein KAJ51_00715, partial [Thermoplasmata archaeon]|nr:hypothetical protein [Thermoplasmata archaeon]
MIAKIKSSIIISLVILSALIVGWNFGLVATDQEYESTSASSITTVNNRLRGEDYQWGLKKVLTEPVEGHNYNGGTSDNAKVVAENGKIYVVWEDDSIIQGSGTDFDIFFMYFDGSKWSDVQVVSDNSGDSHNPDIAVENGKIYIVWFDKSNTNDAGYDEDIFFRCNLTGTSWEATQVISEPVIGSNNNIEYSWDPAIAIENGNIYVVWEDRNDTNGAGDFDFDIFYRCNITGTSWETVQVISLAIGFNSISLDPAIAVETNKTYVTWFDNAGINGAGGDRDIFLMCNLTGTNWEEIQVISEPVFGNNLNTAASYNPTIAI